MKRTLIDGNVLVGRLTSFQELFNTNSRELWGRLCMIIFQEIEPLDCTVCILYELTVRPCRHTCFPHQSVSLPCDIRRSWLPRCHNGWASRRKQASFQLHAGRVRGPQPLGEQVLDDPGVDGVAAREDVDCGIAVLGPGVDRDVRLGDHDDSTYTEGAEVVEGVGHDRRA